MTDLVLVVEDEPDVGLPELDGWQANVFNDGALRVHFDERTVTVADQQIALTPLEFRLICALVRHPDRVLSSDQLLRIAWDDWSSVGSNRVKFVVLRLRRKLGTAVLIESIRGFGYRYRSLARRPVEPEARVSS